MISIPIIGATAASRAQAGPALPESVVLSCSCAGSVIDASLYSHQFLYRGGNPVFNSDPALVLYDVAQFIETPAASSHFAFGTADFDIVFEAKKSANGSQGYDIALSTDASNGSGFGGWYVELSESRGFIFVAEGAVRISAPAVEINDGQYHAWRIWRENGIAHLSKNGVVLVSRSMTLSLAANGPMSIGRNNYCPNYQFGGAIRNVVITRPGYSG